MEPIKTQKSTLIQLQTVVCKDSYNEKFSLLNVIYRHFVYVQNPVFYSENICTVSTLLCGIPVIITAKNFVTHVYR